MTDEREVARIATAQEVGGLVLELGERLAQHFVARAAECGLTKAEAKVVLAAESGDPQPMRSVARKLGYDASNLTGVVDRLEDRGVLDRRADSVDRRVKALVLTERGRAVARDLTARLRAGAGPLGVLDTDQLAELGRLLRLVVTDGGRT